jgi:hypothetical protein
MKVAFGLHLTHLCKASERAHPGRQRLCPTYPPEWSTALLPQVVLLSVSPKDATGFPSPETLEALRANIVAQRPLITVQQLVRAT